MNQHHTFIMFSIFSNQQVEHVQYTPTHIKTRNFVQSIINRQYQDPSINVRHIPSDDDEPSTYTGGLSRASGLIPAIEGPSTSTATGAPPTSYMSISTGTGATGGLSSASGLIPAIEGPSTSTATGVPPLSYMSSGSDFKTYNKNKKGKWLLARDRFNKQLVSNEITVRGLSNTPKAEEEKEVEEGFPASEEKEVDEGSPSSSSSSSSSASASASTSTSSSSSASSSSFEIDDYESEAEDPPVQTLPYYRCSTCFKVIKNPADYYYVENTEAPPPSPVTETTAVSESEDNIVEEEVEEERNYHCGYNPKRSKRFRRSSVPKKVFIFKNKAEVKKFLFENENYLLFSCLPTEETTTIDPNLSQPNNTQQNQKSPKKKEGKIKTTFKKLYTGGKKILGVFNNGLKTIYGSKIVQRAKDAAVDKLEKGLKSVLDSQAVTDLTKKAIEKANDLSTKAGNAMINRGIGIIAGSVIAAGK